ncbi:hypothetical protein KS18_17490 [Photorhabdus luminescens]|nr:hypothetical protein KS18_17490 [Photorhabdus luminescens]
MSGVNSDVHIAATAKGVGFAGKTVVVESDTVMVAGDKFTSGQHRFHLADKVRKCVIQFEAFRIAEVAHQTSPFSQIMQPVAFLN